MAATESNFNCAWRPYQWRSNRRIQRRGDSETNANDGEERKEKSPQETQVRENKSRPDLRMNVFISKESTLTLAKCVLFEQWGDENANLYKYIDYTWRSALFGRQVFAFTDKNQKECLVFHSGLQRRLDGEFIYLVLVPNDDQTKAQKWRIASAPAPDWSFKIAGDLLQYVDGDRDRLPKRCQFYKHPTELLFDTRCVINVDWVKSIESCRQRIQQEIVNCLLRHDRNNSPPGNDIQSTLGDGAGALGTDLERNLNIEIDALKRRGYTIPEATELRALFITSFARSEKIVKANPYFVVPQGFVDSKKGECRLELLLPIFVNIDSNIRAGGEASKIRLCFALALQREESYNGYKAMSILTPDMAYTNARLVGLVNSAWLLAAAWPDIYSSPLLLQHNPHKHPQMFPPVTTAGGLGGMGLAPPMNPMTRHESAPLLMDDPHSLLHPTGGTALQRQSAPPTRFGGMGMSHPAMLGRATSSQLAAKRSAEMDDVTKRSLFVRNIPADWTEDTIRGKFSEMGKVVRITMLPNRNKDSDKQLCLITMDTPQAANTAQQKLNEEEEDGLKVQKQRGRPNRLTRSTSNEEPLATNDAGGVEAERWPRARTTASGPVGFPAQKLTLRIDNLKPQQTATGILELLRFAEVDDADIDWINVYHPDNLAYVRFKTPQHLQHANDLFRTKGEYPCRTVKPMQYVGDTTYWKFGGSGEKLAQRLSDQLERTQYNGVFYENPHDQINSPRITRYDGTLASRFSPETQSSEPLIRVSISSWRRPGRWANSRLGHRRGRVPQSTPLNIPQRDMGAPMSLPVKLGPPPGVAVGQKVLPQQVPESANERKEQPRRTLNPNAVAFNPQPRDVADDDEAHPPGATFVPQPSVELSVPRGGSEWQKLEQQFGRIRGWDINDIVEWQNKVPQPSLQGMTRRQLWFAGLPGRVATLEKEGFLAKHGDSSRGRVMKFTFWTLPVEAMGALGSPDVRSEIDFVLCFVFLTPDEENDLRTGQKWVRKGSKNADERIQSIVPRYIFHTSQRRVGH